MSNITPDQLAKIADLLDESVQAINAYQIQNLDSISGPEHILINNKESEIMAQANKIRNEAIILTIENSAGFLEGIEEATEELKSARGKTLVQSAVPKRSKPLSANSAFALV